jgi:hypothetical protein
VKLQNGIELDADKDGVHLELPQHSDGITLGLPDVSELVGALIGMTHALGRWEQLALVVQIQEGVTGTEVKGAAMD